MQIASRIVFCQDEIPQPTLCVPVQPAVCDSGEVDVAGKIKRGAKGLRIGLSRARSAKLLGPLKITVGIVFGDEGIGLPWCGCGRGIRRAKIDSGQNEIVFVIDRHALKVGVALSF